MSKQLKIIIGAAVGVLTLGIVLFFAQPDERGPINTSVSQQTNVLSTDRPSHDFGTISMKDGKVKTIFTVKNTQTSEVSLTKLYTSCMCTKATLKANNGSEGPFGMQGHGIIPSFNQKLAANQEAEIEVEFDPNAHGPAGVGTIERVVTLEGTDGKLVTLGIKANVTP